MSFKETDHPRSENGQFGSGGAVSMSSLKKVGGKLGSNPGGTYTDAGGKKYYVKQTKSADHAKNEYLAGALYNLAGAKTLKYVPTDSKNMLATEWSQKDKDSAKDFTPEELALAQEDFAVHAWLANWDAAGLDYDNQAIIDGQPTSVDLGGALKYRAQGSPKGSAFGDKVGEYDTLRNAGMNPQNAKLFSGMTDQQLKASVAKVTKIPDAKIHDAVRASGMEPELADILVARKNDLKKRVTSIVGDEADSTLDDRLTWHHGDLEIFDGNGDPVIDDENHGLDPAEVPEDATTIHVFQ